ncbi:MAG: tetratricopeptide repeat protein [Akkermansiaceae bacterium]
MRLQTLIRLVAAIIVLTVVVITLFVISKYFGLTDRPAPDEVVGSEEINKLISKKSVQDDLVVIDSVRRKLSNKNSPKIVLGNPAFEKARSMLKEGEYDEARLKLEEIVVKYPGTPAEREAYRVLGEMRLDDLLEHRPDDGKFIYNVQHNDSYLKIVGQHDTSLDILMYLNGLTRIDRLQPKDKLIIMPLNLSLRIIPRLNQLFLVDERGEVIKYYEPVVDMAMSKKSGVTDTVKTTIENISAYRGSSRVNVTRSDYREASKRIQILNPNIEIISEDIKVDDSFRGIVLTKPDMEELALLLRRSNTVEIRY